MAASAPPGGAPSAHLLEGDELKKELKKTHISDFFQSATLSDITVTNPTSGAQYK